LHKTTGVLAEEPKQHNPLLKERKRRARVCTVPTQISLNSRPQAQAQSQAQARRQPHNTYTKCPYHSNGIKLNTTPRRPHHTQKSPSRELSFREGAEGGKRGTHGKQRAKGSLCACHGKNKTRWLTAGEAMSRRPREPRSLDTAKGKLQSRRRGRFGDVDGTGVASPSTGRGRSK